MGMSEVAQLRCVPGTDTTLIKSYKKTINKQILQGTNKNALLSNEKKVRKKREGKAEREKRVTQD